MSFAPLVLCSRADGEGWGPGALPQHFTSIPFSPFSKSASLGRAAELNPQGAKVRQNQPMPASKARNDPGQGNNAFGTIAIDDDEDFHVVDSRPIMRPKFAVRKPIQVRRGQWQQASTSSTATSAKANNRGGRNQRPGQAKPGASGNFFRNDQVRRAREWSTTIKSDWIVTESISYSQLAKLNFEPGPPIDLAATGSVGQFDKSFSRLTCKMERRLEESSAPDHSLSLSVTASSDKVMKEMAENNVADIFATDDVIALIMTASRTMNSWDVIVNKVNGKLFLDKRPVTDIEVNHSVHETNLDGLDNDPEDVNSAPSLAREAKRAHEGFLTMSVRPPFSPLSLSSPSPSLSPSSLSPSSNDVSCGHIYRKWQLSDDLSIVIRCQVDSANPTNPANLTDNGNNNNNNTMKYELIRTLIEWNTKTMDWRTKLEQARGAVMATEIKNNAAKLARWTASAVLSGCDTMNIGFISRSINTSNRNHVILGSYLYRTREFCGTINLNMANCWGVIKTLALVWGRLPEGKHLLIKDPAKTVVNLYQVPQSFFEEN